tara:strand:+ start:7083 stop:7298 length:216 start_codon:yes stop_codon:yes gene_type:complete
VNDETIKVGDKVLDIGENYQPRGSFIVEEIRSDGWVWGSGMHHPYYGKDNKKNFTSTFNGYIKSIEHFENE